MTGTLGLHGRNTVNYIPGGRDSRNKASGSTGWPVSNMVKHLRADIDDKHFKRFKAFMAMEGASTNDEFIIRMLDLYEKYDNDELLTAEDLEKRIEDMDESDDVEVTADTSTSASEAQESIEF